MSPSRLGADVAALRRLAQQFRYDATTVDSLLVEVDGKVNASWWKGPDADRFRSAWSDRVSRLRQVSNNLKRAAEDCEQQARMQEQTSRG